MSAACYLGGRHVGAHGLVRQLQGLLEAFFGDALSLRPFTCRVSPICYIKVAAAMPIQESPETVPTEKMDVGHRQFSRENTQNLQEKETKNPKSHLLPKNAKLKGLGYTHQKDKK